MPVHMTAFLYDSQQTRDLQRFQQITIVHFTPRAQSFVACERLVRLRRWPFGRYLNDADTCLVPSVSGTRPTTCTNRFLFKWPRAVRLVL